MFLLTSYEPVLGNSVVKREGNGAFSQVKKSAKAEKIIYESAHDTDSLVYNDEHHIGKRAIEELNLAYTEKYILEHCKNLKQTHLNDIKEVKEIGDLVKVFKGLLESQYAAYVTKYKSCKKHMGDLNRCMSALRMFNVATFDDLLTEGHQLAVNCKKMHDCLSKCRRILKDEKACNYTDLISCERHVYHINKISESKLWHQFDTVDSHFMSGDYGCKKWNGWKSMGWLRGKIDATLCNETASYNCDKGYVSCVEDDTITIHRECKDVVLSKTNTDWNRGNVCTIGSMSYNGTEGIIYSQQTIPSEKNPDKLCTLPCFNKDSLYQHFTNQPACSNCILPFEIFWEKDCFKDVGAGKGVVQIHIFKKHTHFEFEKEKKFVCKNEYSFHKCCGGVGPGEEYAEKTMYDKYCYCTAKQNDVYSTVKRVYQVLVESVSTPQFLFHLTLFFIFSMWNKTAATVYIALALVWIIPTAQAACNVEQLLPSDLADSMGNNNLQKLHVRIGQCFQAGGSTFELTKIEALLPYTFLKHVPYHIKATCSKLDWGCLFGKHDEVYSATSSCYENCIEGIRMAIHKEVPSFAGDGCTFGSSVATRHDVCFSGGGQDSYATIFEKLSSLPILRLHLVSHATKLQKKFVLSSNSIENEFMKIHEYHVGELTAPKMYVHRMSQDFCSYTYVETNDVCSSRNFADPQAWDGECLNADQIWDAKNQQYILKYDKIDYENVLMTRFQSCPKNYKKESGNDTLTIVEELNWVDMIVSGKHFQYAAATQFCDLKNIVVRSTPGVSGYHSTTVLNYKNGNDKKCKFAAKLNGCVATEGTFMLLDEKQEIPMTYWCSYNASGILTMMTTEDNKRLINLNVVKNYVPHKTIYGNLVRNTYEKMSIDTMRTSLSGFWGKLDWPQWTNFIGSWLQTEFWKFVVTCFLAVLTLISFNNGNILMSFFFGTGVYIVGFTHYVMAERMDVTAKVVQLDGGEIIGNVIMRIVAECQYLIYWALELEGLELFVVAEILMIILHLTSNFMGPLILVFGWTFRMTTKITNRLKSRSEIQDCNVWCHLPLTSLLLKKIMEKNDLQDDLDDDFAILNRQRKMNWRKFLENVVWCSEQKITESEAMFTMKKEGWNFQRVKNICYVAGYKKGDSESWWVPNHCVEGTNKEEGVLHLGDKQLVHEMGGMSPKGFQNKIGFSGYTIVTTQGIWMYVGKYHEHTLWNRIVPLQQSEYVANRYYQQDEEEMFVRIKSVGDHEIVMMDTYEGNWKYDLKMNHKKENFTESGKKETDVIVLDVPKESNTNVLVADYGLFMKDPEQPGNEIVVSPDGTFSKNGKLFLCHKHVFETAHRGRLPFVSFEGFKGFIHCGSSHIPGYKKKLTKDEMELDYWFLRDSDGMTQRKMFYTLINAQTGERTLKFNLFNECYKKMFFRKEGLMLNTLVFEGNYPSGSALVTDEEIIGTASFLVEIEGKSCTAFVGKFTERKKYPGTEKTVHAYLDGIKPLDEISFFAVNKGAAHVTILGLNKKDELVSKERYPGMIVFKERRYNSKGWTLTPEEYELQRNEAIDTAGYVSEDIGDGKDYQDPAIRDRRIALYRRRSTDGGMTAIPFIFYTDTKHLPKQPLGDKQCRIGFHLGNDYEFDSYDILKILSKWNADGKNFLVLTLEATDFTEYFKKNRLPMEVCVENNFYVDRIYESDKNLCDHPLVFIKDPNGMMTHPTSILEKYDKTLSTNGWNFTGAMCGNKILIGENGEEEIWNIDQFKEKYSEMVIQGMVGNATGTGSFSYSDGKFYTQYHVTKGNQIELSVKGDLKYRTGVATYMGKDTDLVVYGGNTKMYPMHMGEVYCAYNLFYKIGIFLKFISKKNSAQRGGTEFQVLQPVEWKKGHWVEREHYGVPGMSGSPIVDNCGRLVGVYGLQKIKPKNEGKGTQSYVPIVSHNSETKSLFNKAARHIRDVPLTKGCKYYTLVVPTGTGKSTMFPIELLKVNRKRILILQPNRVACIGAYERVVHLKKMESNSMNFRNFVELKMGTTEVDENRVDGDRSALSGITFATYGYMAAKIDLLHNYDIVMLDECHKIDDVDVVSLILYTETNIEKGIKFIRSTASSVALPKEAQDVLDGFVVESTNYHIDDKALLTTPRKNFKDDKNDEIFWFYRKDMNFNHNMGECIVGIEKKDVVGKTVLVFCAEKRECDEGVKMAKDRGYEAVAAYSNKEVNLRNLNPGTWVFATNIVQQSVTINGLYCVVDLGKEKKPVLKLELNEGSLHYTRKLEAKVIDLASRQQRRGRVGRTDVGLCYSSGLGDVAVDCFNESLIPEIILKCELLKMTLEQTKKLMEGRFETLIEKYSWVRTDLIGKTEFYMDYVNWTKVRSRNFGKKLEISMQAEGDWLMLYLRAHCLDEVSLDTDVYREMLVLHGKGKNRQKKTGKYIVPDHVRNRTKKDPETWWENYNEFCNVMPPERYFLNLEYTFQSYVELQMSEEDIDYEKLMSYISQGAVDEHFEESGNAHVVEGDVYMDANSEGYQTPEGEKFNEDSLGIVLSTMTAIGLTAVGASLVSVAINCRGDRYVRYAQSIEQENVKMVAKACAENYEKNETQVLDTLSILEKMKYHLNKVWEKVKEWAKKYFGKEETHESFTEDSLEFLWTTLCAKVMTACAAGGGIIGLAAMPTLTSLLGGSLVGLFVDRVQAVMGKTGAFILVTLLEGVAFWYTGLVGGLLFTGTAILTTLVKDLVWPQRNLMRQIQPNYSKYLSLLTGGTLCAGFMTVAGKSLVAKYATPVVLSNVAPHLFGYGNMTGTFLFFKHMYTALTLQDRGVAWADYLIGLLGGGLAAAYSMNPLGFGMGVGAVVAMSILRMMYKSWNEHRIGTFKNVSEELKKKMSDYDSMIGALLSVLAVVADPWSIVSVVAEFLYIKMTEANETNMQEVLMSRTGVPIVMQIMDIAVRCIMKVMRGEEQFRQDADNSTLIDMLWTAIKNAYLSIKNFIKDKMSEISSKNSFLGCETQEFAENSEENVLYQVWSWCKKVFGTMFETLCGCLKKLKNKVSGLVNGLFIEGAEAGLQAVVDRVPLARHVINLDRLDEDDMRSVRSSAVDKGVVLAWIDSNCQTSEMALAISQLKIGSKKSDTTNPIATQKKNLKCKSAEIWELPVPLCNFAVSGRDVYDLAKHYGFDVQLEEHTLVVRFMGFIVRLDTCYDENYALCRIESIGTTTYSYVEPTANGGVMMYIGSNAMDVTFDEVIGGFAKLLRIDSTAAMINMSKEEKLVLVQSKLLSIGISAKGDGFKGTIKRGFHMVNAGYRKVTEEFVNVDHKDITIDPDMYDYCIFNRMMFKMVRLTQKRNCVTEYQCPSLYHRPTYDSRWFVFPELRAVVDGREFRTLNFERYCKFVVDGKCDLYLDGQISDLFQNMQSVCYNAGMNLMRETRRQLSLWSELGSRSVILLHRNDLFHIWMQPGSGIEIFENEAPPEGRLYDGIRHIKAPELQRYNIVTKMDSFKESTGMISDTLRPSNLQMLGEENFLTNSKGGVVEFLMKIFKRVNLLDDKDNSELAVLAGQEILKNVNKYVSGPLEEIEAEEEYEEAQGHDAELMSKHTYLSLFTAGFDQPTKGRLKMTWYPDDKSRMHAVHPKYRETMELYAEINRMGTRMSGKVWEKLRGVDRYELPLRISRDPDSYHNQVSRGVWKFQQLAEMTEFFNNCTAILSPTCGYGGFEQAMSIIYARHKPRTVYASTLLEEGHRAPDWNNISVDQSNVKIVRLIDENTPGKGNIKDKDFSGQLRRFISDTKLDCIIFDVGEFKNTCSAQFDYWAKKDKNGKRYSLIQGMEKLVELMPTGSKICFKFTGVFSAGEVVMGQLLQYYKRCHVVKLGTSSLFSTEFYVMASGKTTVGKGMDKVEIRMLYDELSSMIYDQLCRARNVIYTRQFRTRKSLRRSDWLASPSSGFAYRPVGEVAYPKGFSVDLKGTPFGDVKETFEPNFSRRISLVQKYLRNQCGLTKQFSEEKRLGLKDVAEIGHWPMKVNVVNEKHKKNDFIAGFLGESFGLNDNNSTYGHTQATAEYKKDSIHKRLDVNPGDLDHKVFMELMTVISTMKTEYGQSQVGQCKMLPHEKVLTMLNKRGATGMFSRYPNMKKFIDANSTKGTDGIPQWYSIAMDFCLSKWSKGDNSHCFFSIMHKNEPKAKKNVNEGLIDPSTVDELEKYNSLPHRFIQYNDEISRIAHYILFGDLMEKANKQKIYKGTINGTPPHIVGRILRSMWDLHEPHKKQTDVGLNKHIDINIEKTELFPKNGKVLKEGTAAAAILDYSKWDTTVTKQERFLEYLFVRQFYPEQMWSMIKKACEELAFGICIDREGHMFVRDGQRGSGEVFFTSFGNTLLVDANTFRCTAHAAGIPLEKICDTVCKVHVKINEKITKTFEITRIPQVADGDDVVIFGTRGFFNQLEIQIDERLSQANKVCRSGTKAGITVVDKFEDVSFCSYKYEPILIGKNARTISLSIDKRIDLARTDHNYKIFYLPTRTLPDIYSRLRLTLKENTTKWDLDDESELGSKALTKSKLISYLLMFPHVRLNRYACLTMLACMGDGNLTQYEIRNVWNSVLNTKMTTMGAMESLYKVDTLDDIGLREYDADGQDSRKFRKNLALTRTTFSIKLRDNAIKLIRTAYVRGIIDPRILEWDKKLLSNYCDFMATLEIDETRYPSSVLKMLENSRRHMRYTI